MAQGTAAGRTFAYCLTGCCATPQAMTDAPETPETDASPKEDAAPWHLWPAVPAFSVGELVDSAIDEYIKMPTTPGGVYHFALGVVDRYCRVLPIRVHIETGLSGEAARKIAYAQVESFVARLINADAAPVVTGEDTSGAAQSRGEA